jgi:peptidoglycan hydrolase-like protein with peptidoglycan-binding domain
MQKIAASVGRGGKNNASDVEVVQRLLNRQSLTGISVPLKVDGIIGDKTIGRVEAFQKQVVKLTQPDGRVDPNGRTLTALNKRGNSKKGTVKVVYSSSLASSKHIVSQYSISVIKQALINANMTQAVITSTIRTPSEQANIMYEQAKKNLTAQFRLYGTTGDEVLKVYKNNAKKTKQEVVTLMKTKIENLLKQGRRTSKHVVTETQHRSLNIIDIGVNSTRAACGTSFNMSGFMTALNDLKANGYIDKVIDETKKTNSCWHIEITPDKKALP